MINSNILYASIDSSVSPVMTYTEDSNDVSNNVPIRKTSPADYISSQVSTHTTTTNIMIGHKKTIL